MVIFNITIHELFIAFVVLLVIVIILIIAVLIYSFSQYRSLKNLSEWSRLIDEKVSEAIVYGKEEETDSEEFLKVSHGSAFRELFLEKLVSTEKKFSGIAQEEIKDLFETYNLSKEAYSKLSQKKPHLIAGGIQELTAMKVDAALPKIESFLKHPSTMVYQESQYAMLAFKGFKGLSFLNNISHDISDWQQLRLLISLTSIPEEDQVEINNWLQSSNNSVVIFALSLLRKFQMLSFYPAVWDLLQHSDVEVRVNAVRTLLSLENEKTISALAEVFPDQPLEAQYEILKKMEVSNDQGSVGFLKTQLLEHPNTGIRIHAAEALFALGHQEYLNLFIQDPTASEELIHIIKHALQKKI
ncbi:HEAT repeat domain-containing protein [Kaistella montana]|uniref:HEAT repeat domain-containing protein n=1 Tax=Kaistella montana TaxID=1849733 RepID=A0ABW5KAL0_9FLAO|nr:HEAT repeat domain-containing protein [Kaistella montana]MCQ4035292.1 HEAT repeat domain-containing protein [Kaistella montana]